MPPAGITLPRLPHERRWDALHHRPVPTRKIAGRVAVAGRGFDFTAAMTALCRDVAARCPTLAHIDVDGLLVTITPSRNRSRYGLQARVTPMRFRGGALHRRLRGAVYSVQRYFVDGRELLYLVTFCLPRFLDQSFAEKLVTVFHELYHVSPAFDGDLRRHPGRCEVHTHSKREYDRHMLRLARAYVAGHPDPGVFEFLKMRAADLDRHHGGVRGTVVPRPKLMPVGYELAEAGG